jgi:AcrR family transcriptional regulator
MEETRNRITAAAFDLHATIGPSRTSISAIALRAGVQRHTVYAHFPEIEALYEACTKHGIEATGMPGPEPWHAIADPVQRFSSGLSALYAWYRANERMLANVLHDLDPTAPPAMRPDPFETRMGALADVLAGGWQAVGRRQRLLRAAVRHALWFDTWRSLAQSGLTDAESVGLLTGVAQGIAAGSLEAGPRPTGAIIEQAAAPTRIRGSRHTQ